MYGYITHSQLYAQCEAIEPAGLAWHKDEKQGGGTGSLALFKAKINMSPRNSEARQLTC